MLDRKKMNKNIKKATKKGNKTLPGLLPRIRSGVKKKPIKSKSCKK